MTVSWHHYDTLMTSNYCGSQRPIKSLHRDRMNVIYPNRLTPPRWPLNMGLKFSKISIQHSNSFLYLWILPKIVLYCFLCLNFHSQFVHCSFMPIFMIILFLMIRWTSRYCNMSKLLLKIDDDVFGRSTTLRKLAVDMKEWMNSTIPVYAGEWANLKHKPTIYLLPT